MTIEVFDSDKIGKDKSLGKLDLDIQDLLNNDDDQGNWYPLQGVKSGQILLSSDFLPLDALGRDGVPRSSLPSPISTAAPLPSSMAT